MKRLAITLLLLLLLASAAAWLATRGQAPVPQPPAPVPQAAAACPTGMWVELSRFAGVEVGQGDAAEIPPDLPWQTGLDEPELGDPRARKGGRVRLSNVGPFPENVLAFGSPTPQFFHANLFGAAEMPLVGIHPVTRREIPGVAEAWARQGQRVYFRLNPRARYSNGRPVRAADVALGLLLRARVGAAEWAALRELAESVRVLGEGLLCVRLREGIHLPLAAARLSPLLRPAEPGFYAEAVGDFREAYRHRMPPTTGAYTLGRVERGRMMELLRVQDWWAKDERYQRYRYNADAIEHHFPTDEAQAWELFLRGRLDALQTRNINAWQRYLEGEKAVEQGRIQRHNFCADYPMPSYGIALNAERLADLALRRGVMQALDMDRAVALLFRGEEERLETFHSGYGKLSPTETPTWQYNPSAARAAFAEAGYSEPGGDGILRRADGQRLRLRFSYSPSEKLSTLAAVLVQSAAACGLELVPEPLPWQQWARQLRERQHELTFWAGVAATPLPAPARFFAAAATGEDAPFALQDAEMDSALAAYAGAGDDAARATALAALDYLIYDRALWLPGWKENRVRLAAWSHIRFPNVPTCRFSTPAPYDVMEAYLYWVDEGESAETAAP